MDDLSIDEEMPSSLREMLKNNSQVDFFNEENSKPKPSDGDFKDPYERAGERDSRTNKDHYKQDEKSGQTTNQHYGGKLTVVGKSEK